MALSANEIRTSFIEFFESKDHKFVPSSPIVPIDDETLLFANAGMNQFKDIFVGLRAPKFGRAANSQKCLRVSGKHNDLEEVGKDTYHHTFFEMLGNWSFDDYFKAEAIEWAWELLTKVWGIDQDKLWATVFEGCEKEGTEPDNEAAQLWTKLTPIPKERVLAFGKKDNFWEMGSVGPCGPCSEIHIDLGPGRCDKQHEPGHVCAVNAGCSRFIELWNLVFIQFNRDQDGSLHPLDAKYIDTGAGLERLTAVMQDKQSNYDTDLFMPIIDHVSELTGHKYTSVLENRTDIAFRVIADHARSMVFAITDGATPSNDGRGYVIRRILRRACRYGRELGMHEPFMYKLVPTVCDMLGDAFGEIRQRADYVTTVIESEEASFGRTLDRGIEIFNTAAEKAESDNKIINGDDAFQLYDTFGFPFDLTRLMAQERGLSVDEAGFEKLMEEQRARARAAQKDVAATIDLGDTELPETDDSLKYDTDHCKAKVIGLIRDGSYKTEGSLQKGDSASIITCRTCFYAESGGQVGDTGMIKGASGQFVVEETAKLADCVMHTGKVVEGTIAIDEEVTLKVSRDREATRKNHTATHLLQWALQKVVGDTVTQQGSLVCPDYLRFDFTCPKALTAEQVAEVEKLIRDRILENEPVKCVTMAREQAQQLGAMALFGEKYGDNVRVVAVGTDEEKEIAQAFSKEFCGGTHVDRLGSIGGFKIIKEESISAGVRRITAMTGVGLNDYLASRSDIVDGLSQLLKVPAEEVAARVEKLIKDNKKLAKDLKNAAKQSGTDSLAEARKFLDESEDMNGSKIIVGQLSNGPVDRAREAVDMLKKNAKSAVIVLAFAEEEKAMLLVGVTDDLVKKGIKAGDIVKAVSAHIGGGGGGRPQMAQAGGKNPAGIAKALEEAQAWAREKLAG